jgi:hypothetical protein
MFVKTFRIKEIVMATYCLTEDQQKAVKVGGKLGEVGAGFVAAMIGNAATQTSATTLAGVAQSSVAATWFGVHGAKVFADFATAAASAKAKSLAAGGCASVFGLSLTSVALPLIGAYAGVELIKWLISSDDDI